jgi:hypothetical protein
VPDIGIATEVDTAFQLIYRKLVTTKFAVSLNEALAFKQTTFISVGTATETDVALSRPIGQLYNYGLAVEIDAALAPRLARLREVQIAVEQAQAVAVPLSLVLQVRVATEIDSCPDLITYKKQGIGMALGGNTAKAPMIVSRTAVERDTALFFQIKRNGEVVFPKFSDTSGTGRRMWTRFVA